MDLPEREDSIQREAMEKGEEKGIEKGIEIGREEGRKEGREEKEKEDLSPFVEVLKSVGTEEETAISLISEKFGKSPEEVREILIMQASCLHFFVKITGKTAVIVENNGCFVLKVI